MTTEQNVVNTMADLDTTIFPLIPMRDVVVFPQMVTPLFVHRPKSISALEQALLRDDRLVVLIAQKDPECEEPTKEDLYDIGKSLPRNGRPGVHHRAWNPVYPPDAHG